MADHELVRYTKGEVRPLRQDRALVAEAKEAFDEVRLTSFKVDGAIALAGHVMEKVHELDVHRRSLAGDDPVTNQILVEVELAAMAQVRKIQAGLYGVSWTL